jgi:hypothetical protein
MKTIVALQLVWLREQAFDNGTVFVVVDEPKDGQTPVQVDGATAGAWLRNGWAEEAKAADPADGSAPTLNPSPQGGGRQKK